MRFDSPEKWIFGEGAGSEPRQYAIHTEFPRFIAEILDDEESGNNVRVIEWLDKPLNPDAGFYATIMRELGEALIEYDDQLEIDMEQIELERDQTY